jgi:hypothetical protein
MLVFTGGEGAYPGPGVYRAAEAELCGGPAVGLGMLVRGREKRAARGGSVEGEKVAERGVPRRRKSNIGSCGVGVGGVGRFDHGELINVGGHVIGGVGTGVEEAVMGGTVALREREESFTWGG